MNPLNVAIVGSGVAGARCAELLADAGIAVSVFDKSRGVGGRLATRRASWTCEGLTMPTAFFDHGVPAWEIGINAEFDEWALQAEAAGILQRWDVRRHRGTVERSPSWLAMPDMPAVCRWLLQGITVHTEHLVDALVRTDAGWRLQVAGSLGDQVFDAVVVAIPPAQASTLLEPHQQHGARSARAATMHPCWTLMGISDRPATWANDEPDWDVMEPSAGPLVCLIRQDAKPGRPAWPGHALWVAHARADWSAQQLEMPAEEVLRIQQQAVASLLGERSLRWHHAAVHRWRYAQSPPDTMVDRGFQWDPVLGLAACGDHLGGGGVVGAWRSGTRAALELLGDLGRRGLTLA